MRQAGQMKDPAGADSAIGRLGSLGMDMEGNLNRISDEVVYRAVGEDLRRAREKAGLTRAELVKRLPSTIKVQTLGSYERGTRQCAIPRLVELCHALRVTVPDLLELALQRAQIDPQAISLRIDLPAITRDERCELQPIRRWAEARLADDPHETVARLDPVTVREMATIFGYTRTELVTYLAAFTPALRLHEE
jgi:transcriptional regulator with XRE-family HTH domain